MNLWLVHIFRLGAAGQGGNVAISLGRKGYCGVLAVPLQRTRVMLGEGLQSLGRPHSQVTIKHIRACPFGRCQRRSGRLLLRGLQPQCQLTTATLRTWWMCCGACDGPCLQHPGQGLGRRSPAGVPGTPPHPPGRPCRHPPAASGRRCYPGG